VPVTQNKITTVVHDYSKQNHRSGACYSKQNHYSGA